MQHVDHFGIPGEEEQAPNGEEKKAPTSLQVLKTVVSGLKCYTAA
jgi:hypothetical protein